MNKRGADVAALLLRLIVGAVFIPHGYTKIFGAGGVASFAADLPNFGIPSFLGYIAAYAEFYGAILLIIGLLTRLDAFLLACTMAVAVLVVQLPDAFRGAAVGASRVFEIMKAIELPLSLFGGTAVLVLIGPGRFSVDAAVRLEQRLLKKKTAAEAAAVASSEL
ncbi:MAG TPA: DoxX family protein [Thermoanaerobaculia bacterium]